MDGLIDDFAAFFTSPARSGVYLTKNEVVALARVSEASLRVNERRRMLADVLRSAQSGEELAAMFGRLADFCQVHLDAYEELARQFPALAMRLRPWQERAARTKERLAGLIQEVAPLTADPGSAARRPG